MSESYLPSLDMSNVRMAYHASSWVGHKDMGMAFKRGGSGDKVGIESDE